MPGISRFSVCPVLLVLTVGSMGLNPGAARAEAPAAGNRIVLIGSSIAAGVGATVYDSSWAGRYGKHLPTLNPAWQLTNLAVPGYTTYHVMPKGWKTPAGRPAVDTAHNLTKALALQPTCLLISLTGNDISNGYAASEYEANFDSLHAIATRAGVQVWITTPLPRTANDSAKRKLVSALRTRILSRYAPRAIDFYEGLGDAAGAILPKYNSGDNIHPNNAGHLILYNRVVAANIPGKATAVGMPEKAFRSGAMGRGTPWEYWSGGRLKWISGDGRARDALGRIPTVDKKGRF